MRMNEIVYSDAKPVDGYGPGFFRVAGELYEGCVICSASGVQTWAGYSDVKALMALQDSIDVLFIGTGPEIAHLPKDLRVQLDAASFGVEVMNSPSACRTYNVLLSEGRRIALAVLPV